VSAPLQQAFNILMIGGVRNRLGGVARSQVFMLSLIAAYAIANWRGLLACNVAPSPRETGAVLVGISADWMMAGDPFWQSCVARRLGSGVHPRVAPATTAHAPCLSTAQPSGLHKHLRGSIVRVLVPAAHVGGGQVVHC
jgi:hypothetical protein